MVLSTLLEKVWKDKIFYLWKATGRLLPLYCRDFCISLTNKAINEREKGVALDEFVDFDRVNHSFLLFLVFSQ